MNTIEHTIIERLYAEVKQLTVLLVAVDERLKNAERQARRIYEGNGDSIDSKLRVHELRISKLEMIEVAEPTLLQMQVNTLEGGIKNSREWWLRVLANIVTIGIVTVITSMVTAWLILQRIGSGVMKP